MERESVQKKPQGQQEIAVREAKAGSCPPRERLEERRGRESRKRAHERSKKDPFDDADKENGFFRDLFFHDGSFPWPVIL